MFSVELSDGDFAFGVFTALPKKMYPWANIYNAKLPYDIVESFEEARNTGILIFDLQLGGVFYGRRHYEGWRVSDVEDHSENSAVHNPYSFIGMPPHMSLKRVDDPDFKLSIERADVERCEGNLANSNGYPAAHYRNYIEDHLKSQERVARDPDVVRSVFGVD